MITLKRFGFSIFLILVSFNIYSQEETRAKSPKEINDGISIKRLFINHDANRLGYKDAFKMNSSYTKSWEFAYRRQILKPFLNLVVPLTIGIADYTVENSINTDEEYFVGLGANIHIGNQFNGKVFQPYVLTGINAEYNDIDNVYGYIPFGVGFNVHLAQGAYLNLQSGYNLGFDDNRSHISHGLGFVLVFGANEMNNTDLPISESNIPLIKDNLKADADADGVPDDIDDCPGTKGLPIFRGCPDSDSDGVVDKDDDCPNQSGPIANGGCPKEASTMLDADGDGVTDNNDNCPDLSGPASNLGCPLEDKDSDGVADADDKCPDLEGLVRYAGCPDTDSDGVGDHEDLCPNQVGLPEFSGCADTDSDGIADPSDKCPTVAGTAANSGCPEGEISSSNNTNDNSSNSDKNVMSSSEEDLLNLAAEGIEFETAKAVIRMNSYPILDRAALVLLKYPKYNLVISGHTDSIGSADKNQKLSENRAKACKKYLILQGVPEQRIKAIGYGEKQPIADNRYNAGRKKNRRVEFRLEF